ncbi:helix-turn-helix transcriptional regulator [Pseudomaricurvus alkylphenolicus]|jgi:transcriptional regulator with XRE-family HTH domain|uniref:helix-turn-helix domain-containing protein n=1 Tax=Pseudomaricurvus alkylphenolicus TaxID=1306991 RepID=UPI001423FCD1|nr:helix-turn-helix transcriptional regulator [Pseudomaricurvus alkylphenolicus]NIB42226.1 helix-turn-helix transcriptional regulator [Pseudomaricurvus alkylphenolicus]
MKTKRRIEPLGRNLAKARKRHYPRDTQRTFSLRIGVSKATYVKMEQGDLSVGMDKYYAAAELLGLTEGFAQLFIMEENILDG